MSTIRIRLDRDLVEELRSLVGSDADLSAMIDAEVRALIERLRSALARQTTAG